MPVQLELEGRTFPARTRLVAGCGCLSSSVHVSGGGRWARQKPKPGSLLSVKRWVSALEAEPALSAARSSAGDSCAKLLLSCGLPTVLLSA